MQAQPSGTASAPPTRPIVTIEVTTITPTCRGVMPIDLSTPISWTRSRVLSTTVLNTPSAATPASSRLRVEIRPSMILMTSLPSPVTCGRTAMLPTAADSAWT